MIEGFSPFSPFFAASIVLLSFLLYHPAIHAVVLFDLCLLGLFEPDAYSSLNDSIWSLDFMLLWAFLTHYIARGLLCPISFILEHPWPICFPQASLAHFLTLHSHGLLLTFLDFPDLITLFFILGAHGLSTDPYFLASLSRACCGPFLLFLHLIIPMGLLFLSLGSSRPIYLLYGPIIHYFCHSALMVFSINPLTLLCPYCWASSCHWASKTSINT